MGTMGTLCGIPAIEMKGTRSDWERLVTKVQDLRKTLKPIEEILFAQDPWNDRNWFDKPTRWNTLQRSSLTLTTDNQTKTGGVEPSIIDLMDLVHLISGVGSCMTY